MSSCLMEATLGTGLAAATIFVAASALSVVVVTRTTLSVVAEAASVCGLCGSRLLCKWRMPGMMVGAMGNITGGGGRVRAGACGGWGMV